MAKSEVAQMFETLPKMFVKGGIKTPRTFYFSLDDVEKWTVTLSPETCTVVAGKTDDADCFIKSTSKIFLDVWSGKKTAKEGLDAATVRGNEIIERFNKANKG